MAQEYIDIEKTSEQVKAALKIAGREISETFSIFQEKLSSTYQKCRPDEPADKFDYAAKARSTLNKFDICSNSTDVRKAAEALSKVYEKDPTLAKQIISDAKKNASESSLINSTENLFNRVIKLSPTNDTSEGWKKYDRQQAANIDAVLAEPMNTPESHTRASELVARIILEGGSKGLESVKDLRVRISGASVNRESVIQDGMALAELNKSGIKDPDEGWKQLKAIDSYLADALKQVPDNKKPDASAMNAATEDFRNALAISRKATDMRRPWLPDPLEMALAAAKRKVN